MSRRRGKEVPCYAANGQLVRNISLGEARKLVISERAVPTNLAGTGELAGWKARKNHDWPAVQLTSFRRLPFYSPATLTHTYAPTIIEGIEACVHNRLRDRFWTCAYGPTSSDYGHPCPVGHAS
jgi:hypothetical protein